MALFARTLFLCLALAPAAHAESYAKWRGVFYGRSSDDTLSSSRVAGAAGFVDAAKDFGPDVQAHFFAGLKLEAGSSSSLFTDEFTPRSGLYLIDARMSWNVVGPFYLSAGALAQTQLTSPLLVADATFPAAMATLDLHSGYWKALVDAEAAIPTSDTLSTKSTGKENTPLLFAQTAIAGYENGDNRALFHVTHFDFRDLTHGMAQDSRFYGNSVNGIAAASTFANRFEGYEAGGDFSVGLPGPFSLLAGGSLLQNRLATSSHNQGDYAYAGFLWNAETFSLRPTAAWYENESDASPGFYSSRKYGHNNRRGFGGDLKLELKKAGLEINFSARDTKLINPQPFQKDQFRYYELTIGIPYANF